MARIRSVHPSLFTDEKWVSCSPFARVFYIGLMTVADDQGLFEWKPLQLRMQVLPGDNVDVPGLLKELSDAELIAELESKGKRLGAIRYFRKFQRPKKPNAVFDLPEEWRDYVAIDEDDDPVQRLRLELWEEQEGKCFYCSTEITHYSKRFNSLDVDHRNPRAKGGSEERENLVGACRACNRGKCDRSESEWRTILDNRNANAADKRAKAELAPQMEDGGGTREKKKREASLPAATVVATVIDLSASRPSKANVGKPWMSDPDFCAAWDLCTAEMRRRSLSREITFGEWKRQLAVAGSGRIIRDALAAYLRQDPDVKRTGGPGFHIWLKEGTWEHWVGGAGAYGAIDVTTFDEERARLTAELEREEAEG